MSYKTAVDIIAKGVELGASDIHLTESSPPVYRLNGRLIALPKDEVLQAGDIERLGVEIMPNPQYKARLSENGQVDFSNSFPGVGRVRVNLFIQCGSWAAAIRLIPVAIPQLSGLGLPLSVRELAMKEKGLILVTGPTGSGKSTTLAAMIDLINHTKELNILTLEDPIEYLHRHGFCLINQREIGTDSTSFSSALRAALRQDPDIILVGEMRDLETISTAMTAAETGHLVLGSLHSGSATQTVERIIDVFPPYQQPQIRMQLATTLQGIVCQQLIPRVDGNSRVVAAEVLIATPAIRNLIRENKCHLIYSAIQTGGSVGMITMDKSLQQLYRQHLISWQEAAKWVVSPENL